MNLVTRLRNFILLPGEISKFEVDYLQRVNRLTMQFFWLHVPVFALIAWANDTGPRLALGLTFLVATGPWVAYRRLANPRTVTLVYGFTAMLMGGLLVHFGQGPVQIEMHFYFFALLAMLALYGNPLSILVAAVTVAVHHLLLWLILPSSVFNYDAPWWVVAVHAAFVVLESAATVYIARSFFDNVIGLEKIVQKRTAELDERNRAMRLVLDNVDAGLITIDAQGRIKPEFSRSVERWFGAPQSDEPLSAFLSRLDEPLGESFQLGWEQCVEGLFPLDMALAQLPSKLVFGRRQYELAYRPILGAGESLEGLLVVISDVSAEVERQRLESEQKETLSALDRILQDKTGFLEFLTEADELLALIANPPEGGVVLVKRALHTLKGNCMVFGIQAVAEICHELESTVIEEQRSPSSEEVAGLTTAWARLKQRLARILGDQARLSIELEPEDYVALLRNVLDGLPQHELADWIANLRLERTSQRLKRVAEQTSRIAKRLGKGGVELRLDDGDLRLDAERWAPFWSAFVHVIRNSLDHGIESPEERERGGKAGAGRVAIVTAVEGPEFVVSIEDDGRGIPWDRVRDCAARRGLPHATQDELIEALFVDGVSTAEQVTEISGRGVGLASMRAACDARGGRVEVRSEAGLGTRFSFRFPRSSMAPEPEDFLQAFASATSGSQAA